MVVELQIDDFFSDSHVALTLLHRVPEIKFSLRL